MISKKRLIWVNALVIIPLLLTACGPAATPPPPTVDVNALYTQAAVTMIAQLTANAPTLTPTPAFTDTPVPTMTPLGGVLPTLPPLATLPALSTPTTAAASTADKAAYVTQSPADYATVTTGKVFNIIWRLRNVGTTTWTPAYQYRYYAAANKIPTAANGYNLTTNVAPNGEVELKVVATAPSSPGTYDTQWVITNPDGVNFALFTLTLNVVQGTSSGGTSATATGAPNACSDSNPVWGGDSRSIDSGSPLTVSVQGGQVYLTWTGDKTATGTFSVEQDGDAIPGLTNWGFTSSGAKWFGPSDTESHTIDITVTGAGTLTVKMTSYNADQDCYTHYY